MFLFLEIFDETHRQSHTDCGNHKNELKYFGVIANSGKHNRDGTEKFYQRKINKCRLSVLKSVYETFLEKFNWERASNTQIFRS